MEWLASGFISGGSMEFPFSFFGQTYGTRHHEWLAASSAGSKTLCCVRILRMEHVHQTWHTTTKYRNITENHREKKGVVSTLQGPYILRLSNHCECHFHAWENHPHRACSSDMTPPQNITGNHRERK
jgi:hypothetical protein